MSQTVQADPDVRLLVGGGIGSGKSAAVRRFALLGSHVVAGDEVGHTVLEAEAFEAVAARWPTVVAGGRIDRTALAWIVFADSAELVALEAMTHPAIIERLASRAAATLEPLVVEVPVMLSLPGEWTKVFIDAGEELRVHRAINRGSSEADVRSRIASQPSRSEWLAWADVVIDNNGSIEDLHRQIDELFEQLRSTGDGSAS